MENNEEKEVIHCENVNCHSEPGIDYENDDLQEVLDTLNTNSVIMVCPDCYNIIMNQSLDHDYPDSNFTNNDLPEDIEDYLNFND